MKEEKGWSSEISSLFIYFFFYIFVDCFLFKCFFLVKVVWAQRMFGCALNKKYTVDFLQMPFLGFRKDAKNHT
ncbi:unnamed protein product [Meloidogyne enterolobii]|uniref:Uncharacterized protein n=1 Tax=Meloidogyne enterolobii TaxID=390850 RepID=A0ACB0YSZ9_MELEN